jgi:hypothetical protein
MSAGWSVEGQARESTREAALSARSLRRSIAFAQHKRGDRAPDCGRVAPVPPDPRLTGALDPFAVVGDRQVLSIQDANFPITEQRSIASAAISSPRLWQLRLSGTPNTPSLRLPC